MSLPTSRNIPAQLWQHLSYWSGAFWIFHPHKVFKLVWFQKQSKQSHWAIQHTSIMIIFPFLGNNRIMPKQPWPSKDFLFRIESLFSGTHNSKPSAPSPWPQNLQSHPPGLLVSFSPAILLCVPSFKSKGFLPVEYGKLMKNVTRLI